MALDEHLRGHFTTSSLLDGHPKGHFIMFYPPQEHPRGHVRCIFFFKVGAPGETIYIWSVGTWST